MEHCREHRVAGGGGSLTPVVRRWEGFELILLACALRNRMRLDKLIVEPHK